MKRSIRTARQKRKWQKQNEHEKTLKQWNGRKVFFLWCVLFFSCCCFISTQIHIHFLLASTSQCFRCSTKISRRIHYHLCKITAAVAAVAVAIIANAWQQQIEWERMWTHRHTDRQRAHTKSYKMLTQFYWKQWWKQKKKEKEEEEHASNTQKRQRWCRDVRDIKRMKDKKKQRTN